MITKSDSITVLTPWGKGKLEFSQNGVSMSPKIELRANFMLPLHFLTW